MAITIYGRKVVQRVGRAIGEALVWGAGPWVTTTDHRHFEWDGGDWHPVDQTDGCGVALASCRLLFGTDPGVSRGLMRGPCDTCAARSGALHHWDCPTLSQLMEMVPPDYWPRPVHRPMWLDDSRRTVGVRTRTLTELALAMDVPLDAVFIRTDEISPVNAELAWAEMARAQRRLAESIGRNLLEKYGLDTDRYRFTVVPFDPQMRAEEP